MGKGSLPRDFAFEKREGDRFLDPVEPLWRVQFSAAGVGSEAGHLCLGAGSLLGTPSSPTPMHGPAQMHLDSLVIRTESCLCPNRKNLNVRTFPSVRFSGVGLGGGCCLTLLPVCPVSPPPPPYPRGPAASFQRVYMIPGPRGPGSCSLPLPSFPLALLSGFWLLFNSTLQA